MQVVRWIVTKGELDAAHASEVEWLDCLGRMSPHDANPTTCIDTRPVRVHRGDSVHAVVEDPSAVPCACKRQREEGRRRAQATRRTKAEHLVCHERNSLRVFGPHVTTALRCSVNRASEALAERRAA
jgi:hypothetical protein